MGTIVQRSLVAVALHVVEGEQGRHGSEGRSGRELDCALESELSADYVSLKLAQLLAFYIYSKCSILFSVNIFTYEKEDTVP
jgi:hypothetical protein